MIILGIHLGHDGGAALLRDGEILCAISEERLSREKYANGSWLAVQYCLEKCALPFSVIDLVVTSNAGIPLPESYDHGLPKYGFKGNSIVVDHHLSHAIGAYAMSEFDKSCVLVCDAGGNDDMTESGYVFDSTGYERVFRSNSKRPRLKGLGTTYEAFTNYLGFSDQESGKTMALAAYGKNNSLLEKKIFTVKDDCFDIESALLKPHQVGVSDWLETQKIESERVVDLNINNTFGPNLAQFIQNSLHEVLSKLTQKMVEKTGIKNMCLSGGVGLNCVANGYLKNSIDYIDWFFMPAASDSGLPLGNAIYGHFCSTGEIPRPSDRSFRYGLQYSKNSILNSLRRYPETTPPARIRTGDPVWSQPANLIREVAERLVDGQLVGWFQGGSEYGPRALGSRSILAMPSQSVLSTLNQKKQREWFRPFGTSLLKKYSDKYLQGHLADGSYMIESTMCAPQSLKFMGGGIHVDNSTRVQLVSESMVHKRYHDLFRELEKRGHAPVLINTSFNQQEPIVETPGQAVRTFLSLDLDVLVIEDFLCTTQHW